MTRVVKQPEERRAEIIAAAKELFTSHGYEKTTVNDVIKKVGVAKGTFYHYFKSKEEIADAVIQDVIYRSIESFKEINARSDLKAIQKFENIIRYFSQEAKKHYDDGLMTYLHREDNVLLHQKMKVGMIKEYVPIVSDIVRQGVQEGAFHTDYPIQITEFLLIGLHFMLDPSFFSWTDEQFNTKIAAIGEVYEKLLGAPAGSFSMIKNDLKSLY